MNIKSSPKKLELKKKTIAHLNRVEMRTIHGGGTIKISLCIDLSCIRTCTC